MTKDMGRYGECIQSDGESVPKYKPDAKAIFAKLEAEARGNYEILAKKGEGLQRIIEACGGSERAFQMLCWNILTI
jgi:hypothetical protein